MAEERERTAWERTAQLLAMTFNMNRGPKTKPIKPAQFNPFRSRVAAAKKSLPKTKDLSVLKSIFVDQTGRGR